MSFSSFLLEIREGKIDSFVISIEWATDDVCTKIYGDINVCHNTDCSGFNLYRRCREHSPTPATHTCVRESRANQRFPRLSTAPPPPLLLGTPTPTAHRNAGRSQFTREG